MVSVPCFFLVTTKNFFSRCENFSKVILLPLLLVSTTGNAADGKLIATAGLIQVEGKLIKLLDADKLKECAAI